MPDGWCESTPMARFTQNCANLDAYVNSSRNQAIRIFIAHYYEDDPCIVVKLNDRRGWYNFEILLKDIVFCSNLDLRYIFFRIMTTSLSV